MIVVTTPAEREAIRADAARKLREAKAAIRRLWPARDDGLVLSEIVSLFNVVRSAEAVLQAGTPDAGR